MASVTVPMRTRFLSIDRGGCACTPPSFFSERAYSSSGAGSLLDLDTAVDITRERVDDEELGGRWGQEGGDGRLIST